VYNTTNYSLEGSRFTLEIIKTAATTGSGTLAAGKGETTVIALALR
jgi:hypothetical protein